MKYIQNVRTLLLVAVVGAGLTVACKDDPKPANGGDQPGKGQDTTQVTPGASAGEPGPVGNKGDQPEQPKAQPDKAGNTQK